jgi:hypothetical protein
MTSRPFTRDRMPRAHVSALTMLLSLTACAVPPDRTPAAASSPTPPTIHVADTTVTARRCVADSSCAVVTLAMPRLAVLPTAIPASAVPDSMALVAVVASLGDSLRLLAGLPPGQRVQERADSLAVQLERTLRRQRRAVPRGAGGFSRDIRVKVVWQSPAVLTVEVEESAFTGGAHGDYEASLRSYDLRTGDRIPITAVIPDTAAIVPLLERGFARAKADSGAAPPPLSTLLFPEVTRLPVPIHFGIVADGVQFLYNPYDVASWAVGRTDVLLTWDQLSGKADRARWTGSR